LARTIALSPWQLASTLALVLVVLLVSWRERMGLERDVLIGTVRTFAQLYAVGLVLAAVFAGPHWYTVLAILAIMLAVAAHTAVARLKVPMPGGYAIAGMALGLSTAATLAYVIGLVIRVRPWYEPQYIIPIAGMILGNATTSAALAGDRLQAELRARAAEVEAMLALGFTGGEAVQPIVRNALTAAMIPTVSAMMTVGVVQLPGMMTGQVLAGASPVVAIQYQILVMFMQAAGTALASLLFVRLAARRYLTPAHQLRRELLQPA
jgi:putative ABC transport system permease protein